MTPRAERLDVVMERITENPPREVIAVWVSDLQRDCRGAAESLSAWLPPELVDLLEKAGNYDVVLPELVCHGSERP